MESLPLERNSSRTIHVLGFSSEPGGKQRFNMGRGHDSEVRVNDISVSRCHAIIKYQPDGIYIEDNKSKFGTLVLLKDRFYLEKDYTYAFQIGRTVVSFTVRDSSINQKKPPMENFSYSENRVISGRAAPMKGFMLDGSLEGLVNC